MAGMDFGLGTEGLFTGTNHDSQPGGCYISY